MRFDFVANDWMEVGTGLTYTIVPEDVPAVIRIISISSRDLTETFADVSLIQGAAKPVDDVPQIVFGKYGRISFVSPLPETDPSTLTLVWRRWKDGQSQELQDIPDRHLIPNPDLLNCEVEAGYILPGSSDRVWTNRLLIDRAVPIPVLKLHEDGPPIIGSVLTVKIGRVHGVAPRIVWKRWDGDNFSKVPDREEELQYTITEDDVNCYICCDVYFYDEDGNRGDIASVETSEPVLALDAVTFTGHAVCGRSLHACSGRGKLPDDAWTWQRREGSRNWIDIGHGPDYRSNADDVQTRLRIVAVVAGERITQEAGVVEEDEAIVERASALIASGKFEFKGRDPTGSRWDFEVAINTVSMKQTGKTGTTVPLKSFEVKASISSDRKLKITAGSSSSIALYPVIQGVDGEPALIRDLCIVAVNLQKSRPSSPTRSQRKTRS
jgi:hypothetical protein